MARQILLTHSKKKFFTRHIRHIHIQGDHNNAKMERMILLSFLYREKVYARFNKDRYAGLAGYQIYLDYFIRHEGLQEGKRPLGRQEL